MPLPRSVIGIFLRNRMVLDLIKTNFSLMRLFIKFFSQRFIFHQPLFEKEILINVRFLSISSTSFFCAHRLIPAAPFFIETHLRVGRTGGGGAEGHGSVSEGEKEGEVGKSIIEADW